MSRKMFDGTQWATLKSMANSKEANLDDWIPEQEKPRIAAYLKYDQMYWNDVNQYELRVLEGENPIYIPNPRIIVDTTAHYLLKGLKLTCESVETQKVLDNFLKRETFYSRFSEAKRAGVTRGDFVFHLTADPTKQEGSRISLNSVPASDVFPIWDEDVPEKMIGCFLATPMEVDDPENPGQTKIQIRRLTYKLEVDKTSGTRRVWREEGIYKQEQDSFGNKVLKLTKTLLEGGYLDPRITALPVYWFKNKAWDGEDFGSSELRGIERIAETVSQGSTDVSAALALEGLGVYATDGGRPVTEGPDGTVVETDWEVAPGKVLEIASGAHFTRVQGVGSITPAIDQINYLESKVNEALGLTDIALGKVDAQVAQSGIALAIKFLPTQAKLEDRDQAGIDKLTQLFYDWKTWYAVFEFQELQGDIVPTIADKMPVNRTSVMTELNNMKDRQIISRAYYRQEMEKLGYTFPASMEQDILDEIQRENQARTFVSPDDNPNGINNPDNNFDDKKKLTEKDRAERDGTNGSTLPSFGNRSNNKNRPNESGGSEANPN